MPAASGGAECVVGGQQPAEEDRGSGRDRQQGERGEPAAGVGGALGGGQGEGQGDGEDQHVRVESFGALQPEGDGPAEQHSGHRQGRFVRVAYQFCGH
ncbi:hypothetical protein ACRAWF_07280 [Streptomyces sp. L7]